MGAEESKSPPEYDDARRIFSVQEQAHLKQMFDDICKRNLNQAQRNSPPGTFDAHKFQAYTNNIPSRLSERLFQYMMMVLPVDPKASQGVNYYNFVISLSHILKGTAAEKSHLIIFLATGRSGSCSRDEIGELMGLLIEAYGNIAEKEDDFSIWGISKVDGTEEFIKILIKDLPSSDNEMVGESDGEKWISSSSLPVHIIDSVFSTCFKLSDPSTRESKSTLPRCVGLPKGRVPTLLDLPTLVLLNNTLPAKYRTEWRFLFNSVVQGESFSTLTRQAVEKGPCILLLRDSDGYVFGAYTGISLTQAGTFTGDETCFLFTVRPEMEIYHTSGINTNYLYFNRGQETLPNGLGLGGQFDYFGLWLDAEYGTGHSKAEPRCTTYNSPQLSLKSNFTIDRLEVWGVGPDPASLIDEDDTDQATSILDTNPEAKAMLEMIGRTQKSEGLREPDPTQQRPPET